MNAAGVSAPPVPVAAQAWRTLRAYLLEAKYEFLKVLRMPAYCIPSLGFPLLFYVLFGLAFSGRWTVAASGMTTYLIATYGAFGVMSVSLFGFGVGVATERGQGWMLQKRATPMPPMAYFAAKLAMSMLFSLLIVIELGVVGSLFGGVRLSVGTWLGLASVLVGGALPFAAVGLALGYLCGPNSAPPVVNLILMPMAFASGLWIPIDFLPRTVQTVAYFLPGYHFAQLALGLLGASRPESPLVHLAALAAFTALGLALAVMVYRRDEGRTYG